MVARRFGSSEKAWRSLFALEGKNQKREEERGRWCVWFCLWLGMDGDWMDDSIGSGSRVFCELRIHMLKTLEVRSRLWEDNLGSGRRRGDTLI